MNINYHTHTTRCKHAAGSEREYVEAAIANGFQKLGFADHTPYPFPSADYHNNMRMEMKELESYVTTVLALKKEYEKDIEIHLGLEVEYFAAFFEDLVKAVSDYPIEYFLLAQHFLGNGHNNDFYSFQTTKDVAVLQEYDHILTTAMETERFTYIAHPDLINFIGDPAIYDAYMRKLCRTANAHHMPLEINFLGIAEGRIYPRDAFWKIAGEEKCDVFFGLDAHNPQAFAYKDCMKRAMELVETYDLHLLQDVTFKNPIF